MKAIPLIKDGKVMVCDNITKEEISNVYIKELKQVEEDNISHLVFLAYIDIQEKDITKLNIKDINNMKFKILKQDYSIKFYNHYDELTSNINSKLYKLNDHELNNILNNYNIWVKLKDIDVKYISSIVCGLTYIELKNRSKKSLKEIKFINL
jgi:hypothetical protein